MRESAVLMKSSGRRPLAITVGAGERAPTGITTGVGGLAVVVAALVAALIPVPHTGWRFAVVAGVVGLFATLTRDEWAVAAVAALSWLVFNGFLVNQMGDLSWHGSPDLLRLMLLVLIGGSGLALGEAIHALANDEKEKRDA
jgi:hypothetical protein